MSNIQQSWIQTKVCSKADSGLNFCSNHHSFYISEILFYSQAFMFYIKED